MGTTTWTPEMVELLLTLAAEGASATAMAQRFGVKKKAVTDKLYICRLSPVEARERIRNISRRRREKDRASNYQHILRQTDFVIVDNRPPAELIAERDRRNSLMPRDLTAAFFGDPLPGFSALERRV